MQDSPTENILAIKRSSHWRYWQIHVFSIVIILGIIGMIIAAHQHLKPWQMFSLGALALLRLPFSIWHIVKIRTEINTLTNQRLRLKSGILSVESSDIELYRVKDILLRQNPIQRMLGLGDVRIMTTDKLNPELYLRCLPAAAEFRELLRNQVELVRDKKRVREVDMNLESADSSTTDA